MNNKSNTLVSNEKTEKRKIYYENVIENFYQIQVAIN